MEKQLYHNIKPRFMGTNKFFMNVGVIFFIILFLNCCIAISESPIVVEPNSEFYLDITLANPDQIGGKYIIIDKSDLKDAILASMPKGFAWGNARVESEVQNSPNDISKPIGDLMLFTSIGEKLIEVSQGEIPIDPLTPLELYGYATNTPTTPPEIVASFGQKMSDNKRKGDLSQFEYRMKNYGFFPISSNPIGSLYPKKIPEGIVIPPAANLKLLIPLRASSTEGDYYIDWTLPYWYTTTSVPNPSTWDGKHIDKQTQSVKRMIEVKKHAIGDYQEQSFSIDMHCTSQGELCEPTFSVPIDTESILQLKYIVPNHCSPISLHIYVDDALVRDTGILGWPGATGEFSSLPLDTGFIDLGPVSPGRHTLSLKAEGHLGGCNTAGYLMAWEGTLVVRTSK